MSDGQSVSRSDGQAPGATAQSEPPAHRPTALVIQTAFLGDVVLTTPLLSALADRHGPVDVMTIPAAAPLLQNHPAVATVLRYDKRGEHRGWRGLWEIGNLVRSRRYRTVYLPHRSLRSAVLALWSGAAERVGFSDTRAALTYTRRVRPGRGHVVDRLLSLAPSAAVKSPPVSLALGPAEYAAADAWLKVHQLGPPFIALAPGSNWGTKRWPYYAELASALERPSVLVGGPEDIELAESIVARSAGRAVSAAGALNLRESAALIQRAALLVTNDSAPLHLATAVGTPIVAVFGPTIPKFGFGPRGQSDVVLGHPALPCRPCSRHGPPECPLGHHRCMRELSVDQVLQAVATVAKAEESGAICPRN
jgi:lipopolysaccharide heptosyltransferase II